jgi:hypothetical protein
MEAFMDVSTRPVRSPFYRGALAAAFLASSSGAVAEVQYPPISSMSDFEKAALEARLTSLATLGANESEGCDHCDVKLTVSLDAEHNCVQVDVIGSTSPSEDDVGDEHLGRGIARRIDPLVQKIAGVKGVTYRSDGNDFW